MEKSADWQAKGPRMTTENLLERARYLMLRACQRLGDEEDDRDRLLVHDMNQWVTDNHNAK